MKIAPKKHELRRLTTLSTSCRCICFRRAKTIKNSLQKDVFGVESDVHIDIEDVDQFYRLKPISVSCIVVYIWKGKEKMKKKKRKWNI
ncbi:hypothetical protein ACS0TY_018152 [Phlomoides rotata]